MNYLKTTDIFGSFALVDKHFNQLTLDINYLQVKNIEGNPSRHYDVLKVLSRCEKLIEVSIEDRNCDEYQFKSCIIKALESSQNLQSLKIATSDFIYLGRGRGFNHATRSKAIEAANLKFTECLKNSKDKLENLEFKEVSLTAEVGNYLQNEELEKTFNQEQWQI